MIIYQFKLFLRFYIKYTIFFIKIILDSFYMYSVRISMIQEHMSTICTLHRCFSFTYFQYIKTNAAYWFTLQLYSSLLVKIFGVSSQFTMQNLCMSQAQAHPSSHLFWTPHAKSKIWVISAQKHYFFKTPSRNNQFYLKNLVRINEANLSQVLLQQYQKLKSYLFNEPRNFESPLKFGVYVIGRLANYCPA